MTFSTRYDAPMQHDLIARVKVLDELNIETTSKLVAAPTSGLQHSQASAVDQEADDLLARLGALKAPS